MCHEHTAHTEKKPMKYHLLGAALLATAVTLETAGFGGGGITLLAAGVGCEV
jgi:hypothetical protein